MSDRQNNVENVSLTNGPRESGLEHRVDEVTGETLSLLDRLSSEGWRILNVQFAGIQQAKLAGVENQPQYRIFSQRDGSWQYVYEHAVHRIDGSVTDAMTDLTAKGWEIINADRLGKLPAKLLGGADTLVWLVFVRRPKVIGRPRPPLTPIQRLEQAD